MCSAGAKNDVEMEVVGKRYATVTRESPKFFPALNVDFLTLTNLQGTFLIVHLPSV